MDSFIYEFEFDNGSKTRFEVKMGGDKQPNGQSADWTRLDYQQCRNCPLSATETSHCPVALDIEEVTEKFSDLISHDKATVRVTTPARNYEKECDVQAGLKSLLGLIMASSDCPILNKLRPMARYHLPFANVEETIFRTVGTYLLRQYYRSQDGLEPDMKLEGLEQLYGELQIVNTDFLKRVRAASNQDANLNAISTLFALSAMVSMTLKEQLAEIKPLFFQHSGAMPNNL